MARGLPNLLRRACLCFYRQAYPDQSPMPLFSMKPVGVDFEGLTKGIDNVHVDVHLSPQFQSYAKKLIDALMAEETQDRRWGNGNTKLTLQSWEEFGSCYTRMIESAVHRAKTNEGIPLIQLAQVTAIKFLLGEVRGALDRMRQHLRNTLTSGGLTSENVRIEANEWLTWLAHNHARLKYKLLRHLLTPILNAEEGTLGELRHSLLGTRWSLPKEFLVNPVLLADSPFDEEFLMRHYVLLGQGHASDGPSTYSYSSLDQLIPTLFRSSASQLPAEGGPAHAEARLARTEAETDKISRKIERGNKPDGAARTRQKQENAGRPTAARTDHDRRHAAHLKTQYAWAGVPANIDLLLNVDLSTNRIKQAKNSGDAAKEAAWKAQRRFQRRLLAMVDRHFRRTGLLRQVLASYELAPLYKEYSDVLSPNELHQFLVNRTTQQNILDKITGTKRGGRPVDTAPLIQTGRRFDRLSWRQERALLVKFLKDLLTFRRDLAHFETLEQAAAVVELRNEPKELRLSQANRTLYEFFGTGEAQAAANTIINHVILKADIRGSTTIVAELRKRSLNPATHFSLNFFAPLNALLDAHGASKVFIEGDAVILSMVEHEETLEHRFSVARMCGIGVQLIDLVRTQNVACRKNELPELELGIGIVYSDEPPTFLFDDKHPIMISPAIGKADRLSSCSWMLRKERARLKQCSTNVDIYEIPDGDPLRGEKGEEHLRYNLNGIELDKAAFLKLQSELKLQKVDLCLPGDESPTAFFRGRYPDLNGTLHPIVVRAGHIRLFDPRHPQFGVPTTEVFYEVVVNDHILSQVEEAAKAIDLTASASVGTS